MRSQNTTNTDGAAARVNRPWRSLGLLLVPTAVVAVDINVLFLAIPALTTDLSASPLQQLWITDVYGLIVGVLAIVAGAVADRLGRRRMLLSGCAGFLVVSILAAFAPSAEVLLIARCLQGLAGATLMPSTLAVISDLFPDETTRTRAVAAWATCQFAFASFGPVVGGVLLNWFWWGSVFLLAVPACLLVLLLGPRLLPQSRHQTAHTRVDVASAGLLIAVLAALFTTIKAFIPGTDTPPAVIVAVAAGGFVGLIIFVRRQRRVAVPLLDVDLLRNPAIVAAVLSLTAIAVVLAGTAFWVTQYLQSAAGLSPLAAAVAFIPMGLGIAAGTHLAPILARYVTRERLIPLGLVVSALGALLHLAVSPDRALPPLLAAIAVTAFGCGPLFAFGTHIVVESVPASATGRAAALAETGNHVGSALGVATIGTLAGAVHARALHPGLGTGASTETMAAARRAALRPPQRDELVAAVSGAGTEALHVVGIATATLLLACAALHVAVRHRDQVRRSSTGGGFRRVAPRRPRPRRRHRRRRTRHPAPT